mgnify:CR=1 FL=1
MSTFLYGRLIVLYNETDCEHYGFVYPILFAGIFTLTVSTPFLFLKNSLILTSIWEKRKQWKFIIVGAIFLMVQQA